mmetsp:Transcript_10581/g.15274  ORF Transcript_10581/g.15274 Transcript_10581/m.15274 type:complete len:192 (-) Transcript_10581:93-668(-)
MVMGKIIMGKTYTWKQYAAACLVCSGVALFALGQNNTEPSFSAFGVLLLLLSVLADAVNPNVQEKLMTKCSVSSSRVVSVTNLLALPLIFVVSVLHGELGAVWRSLWESSSLAAYLALYSTMSFAGVSFYMELLQSFGSAVTVATGLLRKLLTITVSFFLVSKPFSYYYVLGAALLFSGLGLAAANKPAKR